MVNPTGYTALDLVGFTDRGDYVNNANYVKNDLVSYLGSIWRCLVDDTTGIAPAEGVNWTLFMAQPSSNVEQMIAPIEQATASEAIAIGDQFIYNDILYEATAAIAQGGNIIVPPNAGANCKVSDTLVKQIKTIKSSLGTAAAKDVPSSGNASNAQVVLGSDTRLSNSRTPTAHASNATTYGAGNASNYGHVKLSDTYNSNVGAAANSIGASQKALFDLYDGYVVPKGTTAQKTANVESGIFAAFKIGHICVLTVIDFKVKQGTGYNAELITGLPKAINETCFFTTNVYKFSDGSRPAERFAIDINTGIFRIYNGNGTTDNSAIAISDTFIYCCE